MSTASSLIHYPNIHRFNTLAVLLCVLLALVSFLAGIAVLFADMPFFGKVLCLIAIAVGVVVVSIVQFAGSEALMAIAKSEINTQETAKSMDRLVALLLEQQRRERAHEEANLHAATSSSQREAPIIKMRSREASGSSASPSTSPTGVAVVRDSQAVFSGGLEFSTFTPNDLEISVKNIHYAKEAIQFAGYQVAYIESGSLSYYLVTGQDSGEKIYIENAANLIGFAASITKTGLHPL